MTIDEIRERAIENLMLHKGYDRGACEHIVDIVFNTELSEEKCDDCWWRYLPDDHPDKPDTPCLTCGGTGKVTVTVGQVIKKAQH